MLSLNVYPSPENFTQPLVAMVVTFCKSDPMAPIPPYRVQWGKVVRGVGGFSKDNPSEIKIKGFSKIFDALMVRIVHQYNPPFKKGLQPPPPSQRGVRGTANQPP